jgi:hypothetical protein
MPISMNSRKQEPVKMRNSVVVHVEKGILEEKIEMTFVEKCSFFPSSKLHLSN